MTRRPEPLPGLPGGPSWKPRERKLNVSARAVAHLNTLSPADLRALEGEWMIRERLAEAYDQRILKEMHHG